MISSIDQLDLNQSYTYGDYFSWSFEDRVELIHGKVSPLPTSPGTVHQRVLGNLIRILGNLFYKSDTEIFAAPFDIRFPQDFISQAPNTVITVVQPDISVIRDPSILDERGCQGAPDWITEILSPETTYKDLNEKFDLYQHAGVREYWIVHPQDRTLLAYFLNEQGTYQLLRQRPYTAPEKVASSVFPDLVVELEEVF